MARTRDVKPGFFINEDLAEVDPLGRLLFIGMWTIADREGRLEDRPRRIKAELLPYDNCDGEQLITDLHAKGFLIRYSVDGINYIQIVNFSKHQNLHPKENESLIPAPPDDVSLTNNLLVTDETLTNNLLVTDEQCTSNPIPSIPSYTSIPSLESESADAHAHSENKPVRHKYGEYGWVRLSDDEYNRLISEYGEKTALYYISVIDEKAQLTGNKNKWKDWYLTVRKAIKGKWGSSNSDRASPPNYDQNKAALEAFFDDEIRNTEDT